MNHAPSKCSVVQAPVYAPYVSGIYKVEAGLAPLDRDGGFGPLDACVFQFTDDAERSFENKRVCRSENLGKYYVRDTPASATMDAACAMMRDRFASEWGIAVEETAGDSFDALCRTVPEDVCVVQVTPDGADRLVAAHVCAPSHWAPREKIGKSFRAIHAPVAGIEQINAKAPSLVQVLVHGRYKRLGWSVTTDDRLNHHPEPPPSFSGSPEEWRGKRFDPADPRLFVRIERQTLIGLPEVSAFVFTIRVYHRDCATLPRDERLRLRSTLLSMTPASRRYKGLETSLDAIVDWLENG